MSGQSREISMSRHRVRWTIEVGGWVWASSWGGLRRGRSSRPRVDAKPIRRAESTLDRCTDGTNPGFHATDPACILAGLDADGGKYTSVPIDHPCLDDWPPHDKATTVAITLTATVQDFQGERGRGRRCKGEGVRGDRFAAPPVCNHVTDGAGQATLAVPIGQQRNRLRDEPRPARWTRWSSIRRSHRSGSAGRSRSSAVEPHLRKRAALSGGDPHPGSAIAFGVLRDCQQNTSQNFIANRQLGCPRCHANARRRDV